jgi:hypothetical protein
LEEEEVIYKQSPTYYKGDLDFLRNLNFAGETVAEPDE